MNWCGSCGPSVTSENEFQKIYQALDLWAPTEERASVASVREKMRIFLQDEHAYSLDLSNLQLTSLPDYTFKHTVFSRLTSLNLSFNRFSTIPSQIAPLQNLKELYLEHNTFPTTLDIPDSCQQLTKLSLAHNGLQQLSLTLCHLARLEWLDLSNNAFTCIPPEIQRLSALKSLILHDNQLTHISTFLYKLPLELLDLQNNQLIGLAPGLHQCTHLERLLLRKNKISELFPQELSLLSSLQELDMAENCLEALPGDFDHLKTLKTCVLSKNFFKDVPLELSSLSALTAIQLDNNRIKVLPSEDWLTRFSLLCFSHNQINALPDYIFSLPSTHVVELLDNPLPPSLRARIVLASQRPLPGPRFVLNDTAHLRTERNRAETIPADLRHFMRPYHLRVAERRVKSAVFDRRRSIFSFLQRSSPTLPDIHIHAPLLALPNNDDES